MSDFEEKLGALLGNSDVMGKIMSMASALGAKGGDQAAPANPPPETIFETPVSVQDAPPGGDLLSSLGSLDPRIIQVAMRLFSEYTATDDSKTALLAALRPFVKEKRFAQVDRAVQAAKLARIIRIGLQLFKKEGD